MKTMIKEAEFDQKIALLKQKILTFHDEKAKDESFISEDYLDYLALKTAGKTFQAICREQNSEALDKMLTELRG